MYKFNISLLIVLIFSITTAFSNNSNIFEDHKLRTYSPLKSGIKDLFFDIRDPNLEKYVKANTAIVPDDLYYRVYWSYPDQIRIRVEGLPKEGFEVLKANLVGKIKPYVELLFTSDLTVPLEQSKYRVDPRNNKNFIRVKSNRELLDMNITFNRNGQIESINTKSPNVKVKTTFDYIKKSWTKGKYTVSKIDINESKSTFSTNKIVSIDYKQVDAYGLPSTVEIAASAKNGEKSMSLGKMTYNFSNYNINTGQAKKIIGNK